MTTMKKCAKCKQDKDIEEFSFQDKKKNQRKSRCRDCTAEDYRLKREIAGTPVKRSVVEVRRLRKQGLARCPLCDEVKSLAEDFGPNATSDTGYASHCKICAKILAKELWKRPEQKAKKQEYYEDHKDGVKDRALQRDFGITLEEYNKMLEAQREVCAICGGQDENKALAVDHDHKTGKVRKLLCSTCNIAIGFCKDSPELVLKIFSYLKSFENEETTHVISIDSEPIQEQGHIAF